MKSCFIIAEAGVNHNGSVDQALNLLAIAANSGADAVKFQTFTSEKIASRFAPKADYQKKSTSSTDSQLEMLRRLELSSSAHETLLEQSKQLGIEFMSTSTPLSFAGPEHSIKFSPYFMAQPIFSRMAVNPNSACFECLLRFLTLIRPLEAAAMAKK